MVTFFIKKNLVWLEWGENFEGKELADGVVGAVLAVRVEAARTIWNLGKTSWSSRSTKL